MTRAAVLLALVASIGYGASDVWSGIMVRRHSTAAHALWAQVTGLVVLAGAVAVVQQGVPAPALAWGAVAGALGALGVLCFYTALQRGRTSIVAPVAAAGVVIPVLVGILEGESVGLVSGAGVLAAVAGVVVVAATDTDDATGTPPVVARTRRWKKHHPFPGRGIPGRAQPVPAYDGCVPDRDDHSSRSSVAFAASAALAFGAFFVALDGATAAGDVAGDRVGGFAAALTIALAMQGGALVVTVIAATRHTRECLRPVRSLVLPATAIGMLDVGADFVLTVAIGIGPLALVGPLGSLDPVVAVVIATVLLGERMRRLQSLGVVVVLAGITLIAVGQYRA